MLARLALLLRCKSTLPTEPRSLYGPKRILAVDDSPTFLHALSDQLRDDGHDVVCASSGEDAVALLDHQSVDCVLLDLVMPGLSGMETCRVIKTSPASKQMPVIILTGSVDMNRYKQDLGEIGYSIEDVSYKPIDLFELYSLVQKKLKT